MQQSGCGEREHIRLSRSLLELIHQKQKACEAEPWLLREVLHRRFVRNVRLVVLAHRAKLSRSGGPHMPSEKQRTGATPLGDPRRVGVGAAASEASHAPHTPRIKHLPQGSASKRPPTSTKLLKTAVNLGLIVNNGGPEKLQLPSPLTSRGASRGHDKQYHSP